MNIEPLLAAIVDDDLPTVRKLLKADPALATCLIRKARLFQTKILHWIYVNDTPLHLAAAGHRVELVQLLLDSGADPNSAKNHRRGAPLHYAADGSVGGPHWNAKKQVETMECLLAAGSDINAQDKNDASPLHRAVRTRCAAAVKLLLDSGADFLLKNKNGSTPFHLAVQDTGRGGSGTEPARAGQQKIIQHFLAFGVSSSLKDSRGISVFDRARSDSIRMMLSAS